LDEFFVKECGGNAKQGSSEDVPVSEDEEDRKRSSKKKSKSMKKKEIRR